MPEPAIELLPYQKAAIESPARFTWNCWARQTGKSFTFSLRRILRGLERRRNQVFLSAGERQSRELMQKVRMHCSVLKIWSELRGESFWRDSSVRRLEARLPGGVRIIALPANPATARGFSGDVFLDEFAMHRDDKAIWAALFPTLLRGEGEELPPPSLAAGFSVQGSGCGIGFQPVCARHRLPTPARLPARLKNGRYGMFVEPRDLVEELRGGGGEPFESFMRSLIGAEAATHGISENDIDWDYRTNCPDGGCDIFIRKGHGQAKPKFIPAAPSIWSLKGGDDGIEAATLRAELNSEPHDRLREHLTDGDVYVWCVLQPVSQPKRKKFYDEVEHLAAKIGFRPSQIEFRWNVLAPILEAHWNLIIRHLPKLGRTLRVGVPLEFWPRESPDSRGFDVNWVSFSGRDSLKKRIQAHLLQKGGDAVLHIGGLSGIGKTRTAIQACLDDERLTSTLYVPRCSSLEDEPLFLRRIQDSVRSIRFVIDEVPLAEYQRLSDRFRDCGDRVRIVTLGPARRGERSRASVLIMEEPDTAEGVLRIVQEAGPSLPEAVQRSIAENSAHDLRLALLLVRAALENPEFRQARVCNLDDVWERVTTLFGKDLAQMADFPALYEKLTVAIDVGRDGRYRSELEYVAEHFGVQAQQLDGAIDVADRSGLGLRTRQFFEAVPRALAVWVFADRLWRALEPTVDKFLDGMPTDRLRRRFIERCQEVQGHRREEVLDRVGHFFLRSLGERSLLRLSNRETSRVFEAWAELDPERGLPWLVRAAKNTTDEELRAFEGSPDGSGGWRGRRQIVWLCEHLACFKEHFWDCERVLFRLAQVETEESIGNNSRNTWKAMYLPALSNTEVPFPERWLHLLTRLERASAATLDLVLEAVTGAFDHIGGRQVPPAVVGGRVVPEQWWPRTHGEMQQHKETAAKQLLETIEKLPEEFARRTLRALISHLSRFIYFDIRDDLRRVCSTVIGQDAALLRALRAELDSVISWETEHGDKASPVVPELNQWRAELSPAGLREEVVDLTSRDFWSLYRALVRGKEREPENVYEDLSPALLNDLSVLEELEDWFGSESCRSGGQLGFRMGKDDVQSRAMPLVLRWLGAGRAAGFASGYLHGFSLRAAGLPDEAVPVVEQLAESQPELAVQISIEADRSERGFERIVACLGKLTPDQRGMLRSMAFSEWPKIMTVKQEDRLLMELEVLAVGSDSNALGIAFDLMAGWSEHGKVPLPQQLMLRGLQMLKLSAKPTMRVEDRDWKVVADMMTAEFPAEMADLVADALTDVKVHRFQRRRYAQAIFQNLAGRDPKRAMEAIGRWVMDEERGPIFCAWELRGLFDSIGLDTVRPWVERHGAQAAIRLARHLNGPSLDSDGKPIVPALADWLLTEFENEDRVFSEFCMGRHSGEVRCGNACDHRDENEKAVKPFLSDPRGWVQKWAKYELEHLEWEIKHDDEREDERERT